MHAILEMVVANALVAGLMGLAVLVVERFCRRPALVHCLWLLLLIKLVTPPVPIPITATELGWIRQAEPIPATSTALLRYESTPTNRALTAPNVDTGNESESIVFPAVASDIRADEGREEISFPPPRRSKPIRDAQPRPPQATEPATAFTLPVVNWRSLAPLAVILWLVGTAVCLAIALSRAFRFQRSLRHASPAPAELQATAARLAARLGLKRTPRVLIVDASVSPMLWCFFGPAKVLFPRRLLAELNQPARETLLAHELAHYRRRDHLVRFVELLVVGLYWWHPIVWLAVRQLRRVEEACCDTWVVLRLPEHRTAYARALIDTVRFLSDSKTPLPASASGIGQFAIMEHRVRTIMTGPRNGQVKLSPRLRALVVLLTMLVPFVPIPAQEADPAGGDTASPTAGTSNGDNLPLLLGDAVRPPENEPTLFRESLVSFPAVRSLAVSSDNKILVAGHGAAGTAGAVSVWDLQTRKKIAAVEAARGANRIALSTDGTFVAHSHGNSMIRVRRVDSLEVVAELPVEKCSVSCMAFSPDGVSLAITSNRNAVALYRVGTWEALPVEFSTGGFSLVYLAFSPDGSQLIGSGGSFVEGKTNGRAVAWDVATGRQRFVIPQDAPIMRVAFSPDGKRFATAGLDGNAKVCDAQTGEVEQTLAVPKAGLQSVAFASDGRRLAAIGGQSGVTLFDLSDSTVVARTKPQRQPLRAGIYSPDGSLIVVGDEEPAHVRHGNGTRTATVGRPARSSHLHFYRLVPRRPPRSHREQACQVTTT